MSKRPRIFDELERIAPLIPTPIYWLDTNYIIIGATDSCLDTIGSYSTTVDLFIGKTYYDYYPKEIADELTRMVKIVLETGQSTKLEEKIVDVTTGKFRYYETVRSPLLDEDGSIVGTICTSIETTDKKEEEVRLKLENQAHKVAAEEQAKFRKIVGQMSHDMGSPLMALSVLQDRCAELPESKRKMLRESIKSIREIANSLLNQYKPKEMLLQENVVNETLVHSVLDQIIMDKQYEYHHLSIKFELKYDKKEIFSFIKVDSSAFKRMLSNLINNSVDACEGKDGAVCLNLDSSKDLLIITIRDNGKGMKSEVINMLMKGNSITHDKHHGFGIGFTQIRDTLQNNNGEILISSEIGVGTKISIEFPKIETPAWIAKEIKLNKDDIIVILDDDPSIHGAWDIRFEELKQNSKLEIKHFTVGKEAISFINGLNEIDKIRVFLLTDYELIGQRMNGLDVINRAKIDRSILVTSHANDKKIRNTAELSNTRILPKQLASEIPMKINDY